MVVREPGRVANTRHASVSPAKSKKVEKAIEDDHFLEEMGHKPELQRNFSFISMLGLAFAILNSWTALAVSMSVALPSGGPTSVIWGLITAGICSICLASSLAEFLSAYPTAGGQYHWVAIVSPSSMQRFLSYFTGWINVGGWIAMAATGPLLASQLITGIIALMHPSYEPQRWHQFLMYLAYSFLGFVVNAFGNAILPIVNKACFYWSMTGFVVISIVVLSTAAPDFATAEYVFGRFENETGWPDGVAWLLGLLQGAFGLAAYDSVAHMIEEIPNARVQGPRVMVGSVLIGISTGFIFLVCLLFASGGSKNFESLITTAETPLIHIFSIATKSKAGAVCLTMFPLLCMIFTTMSLFTASSRMSYAFARDNGLPFSTSFAHLHQKLKVPLNALILTLVGVIIFGLIYLGSSSAFNAITSAAVVWLNMSYGIPVTINLLSGRSKLPPRHFHLGNLVGYIFNIVGILYVILTTVLFLFPPSVPTTGNTMNYCVVAYAILLIFMMGWWIAHARKQYKGPPIEAMVRAAHKWGGLVEQHSPFSSSKSLHADKPLVD